MRAAVLVAAILLIAARVGLAQTGGAQPVQGIPVTTTTSTGTIAVTNTFQIAAAYNRSRRGGYIQNNGANFMFVYLGGTAADCTAAGATKGKSIQLQPPSSTTQGGSISFGIGNTIVADLICVTGTNPDTFSLGLQ